MKLLNATILKEEAEVIVDCANFAFTEGQLSEGMADFAYYIADEFDLETMWTTGR